MVKEFNKLEEIQEYYDKPSNTYIFKVKNSNRYIDFIVFKFHLDIDSNIDAFNIDGMKIEARNISAHNINAEFINAWNIQAFNISSYDIIAYDIKSQNIVNVYDIVAYDIDAYNIEADNIYAHDISYWAVCLAYRNIKCKSINGRRENARHFTLDGKLMVIDDDE